MNRNKSCFLPYGRQCITEADIAAVEDVLRSSFLTQGPTIPAFETAVASKVGARYGVAVNSATSALHIACLALGLGTRRGAAPLGSICETYLNDALLAVPALVPEALMEILPRPTDRKVEWPNPSVTPVGTADYRPVGRLGAVQRVGLMVES